MLQACQFYRCNISSNKVDPFNVTFKSCCSPLCFSSELSLSHDAWIPSWTTPIATSTNAPASLVFTSSNHTLKNLMLSRTAELQDPVAYTGIEPQRGRDNSSKQEYIHHPSLNPEMGLRYVNVPSADDLRYVSLSSIHIKPFLRLAAAFPLWGWLHGAQQKIANGFRHRHPIVAGRLRCAAVSNSRLLRCTSPSSPSFSCPLKL